MPPVRICALTGLTPAEQKRLRQEAKRIQRLLAVRASREFHSAEAETAEDLNQPFAAVFQLDRLLPLVPDQRANLLERRAAVLTAALKKTPGDSWAARALARQVVSDPRSVSNRESLMPILAALAKHSDDAASHRLPGGLLFRTGSAKEAITALRTAIEKRGANAPPVEELLLTLAHLHLNQPAGARKHLKTAVAWMQRGSEPARAAALAGLAARGPLAALGTLVVTPPDPRLVPLDHQTAHELTALRAEVERGLLTQKP
jgi:hypothetical protein